MEKDDTKRINGKKGENEKNKKEQEIKGTQLETVIEIEQAHNEECKPSSSASSLASSTKSYPSADFTNSKLWVPSSESKGEFY